MLSMIPDALYGRIGAVLSALIAALSVIGLTMHRDFYAGRRRKDFFCFYTNVSNLLVFVYFALAAPHLYANKEKAQLIPHAEFAVMMCIMLTFSVFHLMLYPSIRIAASTAPRTQAYWIVYTDNLIIHYIVPLMVFAYWLLSSPNKQTLGLKDIIYWTMLPLAYTVVMLIRGAGGRIIEETQSPYPYPFMDVRALGIRKVILCCTALYACALLAGACVIGLIQLSYFLFGKQSLILI